MGRRLRLHSRFNSRNSSPQSRGGVATRCQFNQRPTQNPRQRPPIIKMAFVEQQEAPTEPPARAGVHSAWQVVRFGLHLSAVYLTVHFCSIWLAGRFHDWAVPLVDPGNGTSTLQFVFTHLFAFTFIPGFAVGLVNAKYCHKVALFVWTIPATILAYKFSTFPTTVFQSHFRALFIITLPVDSL
jgi:hypothetical protein